MIKKLKKKFTLLATVSIFILMALLVGIMNAINFTSVIKESDTALEILLQPGLPIFNNSIPPERPRDEINKFIPRGVSPEVPYESRFFSVTVTSEGKTKESNLSRIISVDEESAKIYIDKALSSKKEKGFIGEFRFAKTSDGENTKIIFLDCGRKLDAYKAFLLTSVITGFMGCVIVFILFLFVSGRIVKPIGEAYEKQKRFISDAGHEVKTPLTIISANVDLIEGEENSEETEEIRLQIQRLASLTNNLVYLTKMDESENKLTKEEINFTAIVKKAANSFKAPAALDNIEILPFIEENAYINANPDAIERLVSILFDNALKYSPLGGKIEVRLINSKKSVEFSIKNFTKGEVKKENLTYVFDRFYRMDSSRNSETGGHGIGLSIAKAITEQHGGAINAETTNGHDFIITVAINK